MQSVEQVIMYKMITLEGALTTALVVVTITLIVVDYVVSMNLLTK